MIKHADNQLIVCHECGVQVTVPSMAHKQKAHCPRCGHVLTRKNLFAIERMIAFSISALVFLVLSVAFKFLGFSANGLEHHISILGGLQELIAHQYLFLAVIQLVAIVVFPALILFGLLYLLVPTLYGTTPPRAQLIVRIIYWLLPWCMAEIFLLGVLVSLIKISELAAISLGPSFYSYVAFTVFITLTFLHMDKQQLVQMFSARHLLHKPVDRSRSIQHTWALLITSVVLYIPANALPIMYTRTLATQEPNTIVGGIVQLWQHGSYPIAIIIFIASVLVPIGKLVILAWLNSTVQRAVKFKQSERIFWYRVTEFIGRWSMVDIFVVAILVSLIQLGNTMSVYPGPAAIAFCAVVGLTMLAAMTFDSRLIWDDSGKQ